MADGPWRCSECGTVNEPVANSCRTCGRWPSLFDLEASIVDDAELEDVREPAPLARAEPATLEPQAPFEPEAFESELPEQQPFEPDEELDEAEEPSSSRGRQLARWIVPLAFAVYLVISVVFGER